MGDDDDIITKYRNSLKRVSVQFALRSMATRPTDIYSTVKVSIKDLYKRKHNKTRIKIMHRANFLSSVHHTLLKVQWF